MKLYLAGPMTGIHQLNSPAFEKAAKALRQAGFEVYNPAEVYPWDKSFPKRQAFADYMQFIALEADGLALMPDWHQSTGAKAEYMLAINVGLKIFELSSMADDHPLLMRVLKSAPPLPATLISNKYRGVSRTAQSMLKWLHD